MNNRALTLSLFMAVFAVFMVYSYVSSIEEESKKKFGAEVVAVVARRDIREMETITETMLELKSVPKLFLEPSAVSMDKKDEESKDKDGNKASTKTLKGIAGSVALVPIKKGEQITYNKITEPGMKTGLASQVTPGKRAVAIPVDEKTGVAKLIKPGDRVDLIAVSDLGGGRENKIAKTVFQDVVVLATGRYITNNVARLIEVDPGGGKNREKSLVEDFSFTTVTLEVEPAQAQALALLMNSGDNVLTLALRNNDDLDRNNYPAAVLLDIFGPEAARVKAAPGARR